MKTSRPIKTAAILLLPISAFMLAGCGAGGGDDIVSLLITRAAGGVITNKNASLTIPPNSLAADTTMTAVHASGLPAAPAGKAIIDGTAFAFGPDGTTFSTSATLAIGYDPAKVPSNVSQASLTIYTV